MNLHPSPEESIHSAMSAMSIDDRPRPSGVKGGVGGGSGQTQHTHGHSQHQQQQHHPQQQQLPVITPEDLPPEMLEAFNQLDPDQQRQALEMLAQQQLEQRQMEEARPDEHFLTIALNGEILFFPHRGIVERERECVDMGMGTESLGFMFCFVGHGLNFFSIWCML